MTREVSDRFRLQLTIAGILSLGLATALDFATGPQTRLNILFVLPVLFLTRGLGRPSGVLTAITCAGLSLGLDLWWRHGDLTAMAYPIENAVFRGALLVIIAVLFANLRESNTQLDRRVREATVALEVDIAEREQVEHRLRSRELLLSATLASTVDGILVVDSSGKTVLTNQRFVELWRIPQPVLDSGSDEVMLNFVQDQLVDPGDFVAKVASLYASDAPGTDILAFKDGRVFERYSLPLVSDGVHTGRVWSFRDITARRETERSLSASEERLRTLFDRAVDGILVVSPDGNVISVNRSFADMHGYTPEEMRFMTLADLNTPESLPNIPIQMALVLAGSSPKFEAKHYHRDGHVIPLEVTASLVTVDNEPLVQAFHRDITERKQAEARTQALLREKEALLREVHHRVKNNLQIVTSLLRLEGARSTQSGTKEVLVEMQGRVRSMAFLHEALYRSETYASIDLGAYLKRLTTEAFRTLAVAPGAVELCLNLASIPVEMDQAMPCGLLVNELLSNGLEHGFPDGRTGKILITLQRVTDDRAVQLCVSDTGIGLPADFDARRSRGLGLQLVSDLAKQLGGTLHIGTSAAEFTVTFPLSDRTLSRKAV